MCGTDIKWRAVKQSEATALSKWQTWRIAMPQTATPYANGRVLIEPVVDDTALTSERRWITKEQVTQ